MAAEEQSVRPPKRPQQPPDDRARAQRGQSKLDPALIRKRQRAFTRRQNTMFAQLPLSRVRRMPRASWAAVALVGIIAGGYFGRTLVVEQFPSMAGRL